MKTTPAIAFERRRTIRHRTAAGAIERFRIDCPNPPRNRWLEIRGPGVGLRWVREGSCDFFSFAELIKTIVRPGMSDHEKALAVYRFSNRNTHGFGVGFGGTEMTRFLNCFGYSFCWGQADFQHLLYEAAGLRARAPMLKGHSSVEVLLDGQWRMFDPFMRLLVPSPELDGLATGKALKEQPEIWDHTREGYIIANAKSFWSIHGPGGTYQPWQDSRAMTLSLRRGEALRFEYDRREAWCVAPAEPPDFCNGEWTWRPVLDAQHLAGECDIAENVAVQPNALAAQDPAKPARIEYRFKSPYPFSTGSFAADVAGAAGLRMAISKDNRKTWTALPGGRSGRIACDLTRFLSLKRVTAADANALDSYAVCDVVLRLEWTGALLVRKPVFRFLVQAHNPSLPRMAEGVNRWALLSSDKDASIGHAWDEYPGLTLSTASPLEGETVAIRAVVHNRGSAPARRVKVRFVQAGTNRVLGQTVIAHIAPKRSAMAQVEWKAKAYGDRPTRDSGSPRPYVRTVIRAEVGPDSAGGSWTGVAEVEAVVRPRPIPKFNEHLTWSSDGRHVYEEKLILRAALVHLSQPPHILYQLDVRLSATITPFLGHPDKGGLKLAEPRSVADIQPSEFGVAEWTLSTHSLPPSFDVWFEVKCDDTVMPEHRRLLARRRVRLQ